MHESVLREYYPNDWEERLERASREGASLAELRDLPLILPSHVNRLRTPLDRMFRKYGMLPKIALETSSHSLLLQLGCQGGGVALLNPLSLYELLRLRDELPTGVHSLPLCDVPKQTISLARPADAERLGYVDDMMVCIREEFGYYREFLKRYAL